MRNYRKEEEFSVRKYLVAGLMALTASPVLAGGVERSTQSMAILFQEGRYIEIGAQFARPRVSGDASGPFNPASGPTGNIARRVFHGSLAYKADINEQVSYAIILDEPIGADVSYPSGTDAFLSGSKAKIDSTALTGVLRYSFGNGFSAYAGVRSVWSKGSVDLVFAPPAVPSTYTMQTNRDQAWGYLLGAAYEIPEIAARVSLTYNSKVKHKFDQTVNGVAMPDGFETTIPESLHLEFQSGIAEDTILMGSVRWVRWQDFNISPAGNPNLVSYDRNSVTYTLGVGRRFNENWSGSVMLGYDTGNGKTTGNLQPVSSRRSIGLGASYTVDNITISGGVQYSRFGDATTRSPVNGTFSGNSMIGAGVRVGFSF